MRVISGRFKGKKLTSPAKGVRPTLDRVKEAIFSIIAERIPGSVVLDLYSGTGALGIEAISRGAEWCDFVDKSQRSFKTIKKNIEILGIESKTTVHAKDVLIWLNINRGRTYDIVFADPPYAYASYDFNKLLTKLEACSILKGNTLIVLEKFKKAQISIPSSFIAYDMRKYGDTEIIFIKRNGE